jgi:hypothetical protein
MYTKTELRQLRDLLIEKRNSEAFNFSPGWVTASYIYDTLLLYSNPSELEAYMASMAIPVRGLPVGVDETDFVLAYDLLFGDISTAPLHINDAFELISVWRMRSPNSMPFSSTK